MRFLLVASIVLFLVGCPQEQELPEEYVVCHHLYDRERTIVVKSFDDIEQVSSDDCPDVIIDGNGNCPSLFRLKPIFEEEVVYLTDREFENYNCKQSGVYL